MNYKIEIISEDDHDIRLDRWFQRHYSHVSKGLVDKLARKGAIRLDGKRCKGGSRIAKGQELRIPPSILNAEAIEPDEKPMASPADIKLIKNAIIHEDRFIYVVNKPQGLAAQGGSGITRSLDVIMNAIAAEAGHSAHLVHRLDKDTSGIIIVAKSPNVAAKLTKEFKSHDMRKIYLAVLKGCPRPYEGEIDMPLRKAGNIGEQKVIVDYEQGQKAVTLYQMLENAGSQFSLVAFSPLTGRTHQLRVHATEGLKYPIMGDGKYGGEEAFANGIAKKLHLHAWQLHFKHPGSGEQVTYIAPLSDTLKQTLETLALSEPDTELSD